MAKAAARTKQKGRDKDEELALLCKALAHPARVRIIRVLLARGACICGDIVEELPLAQSTVSQHLKVLRDCGVVIGEIDGPRRCYGVAPAALLKLKKLVATL